MEKFKNKTKLVAVLRETAENKRNNQPQNTLNPEMAQKYITQVSEETGGRVITKVSDDFSRMDLRILCALSKLEEFYLNPQVRTFSGTVLGTSRSNDSENRDPTGVRSLNDPYPKVEFYVLQASTSLDSDREETYHKYGQNAPKTIQKGQVHLNK